MSIPAFVAHELRALVGPLALWAPHNIGPAFWAPHRTETFAFGGHLRRWCGVDTTNPSIRLAVLTYANNVYDGGQLPVGHRGWGLGPPVPSVGEYFAGLFFDGAATSGAVGGGVEDRWRFEAGPTGPAWIARRAHPGVNLEWLLHADRGGAPPRELLSSVVRGLTSGAPTCDTMRGPRDVVVGVDGVVTVDGFDLPRAGLGFPLRFGVRPVDFLRALHNNADEFRRLVGSILPGIDSFEIDAVIAHVAATTGNEDEREREREIVADVVDGLAPAVVRAEHDVAEELAMLGPASFTAWATPEGQGRATSGFSFDRVFDGSGKAYGCGPPVRNFDADPGSGSFRPFQIVSDVDVRFVGSVRIPRSRFICRGTPIIELLVGKAEDINAYRDSGWLYRWAIVIGAGAVSPALPQIRVSTLAEARHACRIVCAIFDISPSADHRARMTDGVEGWLDWVASSRNVEVVAHKIVAPSLVDWEDALATCHAGRRGRPLVFAGISRGSAREFGFPRGRWDLSPVNYTRETRRGTLETVSIFWDDKVPVAVRRTPEWELYDNEYPRDNGSGGRHGW
jgi:hypothetical protein